MIAKFDTAQWDAFFDGVAVGLFIWWLNVWIVQPFKKAWKQTAKEMKKREKERNG